MFKIYGKIATTLLFYVATQLIVAQETERYLEYLENAMNDIDIATKKSQEFLDSIPRPLEDHIKGQIDEYHIIQGLIHCANNNDIKAVQSFSKALSYAEKENDHFNAGYAYIQLYRVLYDPTVDNALALRYLDKAKKCFKACNNTIWLYEIELIEAYMTYLEGKLVESINMIVPNLDDYKKVLHEDAYIYMDATSQLAICYLDVDSIAKARNYFSEFKTTVKSPSAPTFNYNSFNACVNMKFASHFLEKKQIDSCKHYLSKTRRQLAYLDKTYVIKYYNLCANLNKSMGNFKIADVYLDSIIGYEDKMLNKHLVATTDISQSIRVSEEKLNLERNKRRHNVIIVLILLVIVILLSLLCFVVYRNQKKKLLKVSSEVDTLSYMKSNSEQLAVKVQGLEEYINNLKKEVKTISVIECIDKQKTKIKELYKNLHINSAIVLDKSDQHLELINDLNIGFFRKIDKIYPDLNKSEVIICYYITMGFSNKEIAMFLNTTIRAVESRRYRISKKIYFDRESTTLLKHLQLTFKDTILEKVEVN
ncbi:hypothetical protein H7U19_09280 [Hyunsoonleella sp. SJ7]|uniref:HTH luxR-type domain-containing protein n=1 Tax=Hyunsoonleella aquatilis TaxID=2762758 RepID=A0A923HC09_9FLAO|nr:hypothetical protein [Hyunsoonleella aquatilis]MBC3758594.1 hypothetical protein [Hyunsoonleella aquatilis]